MHRSGMETLCERITLLFAFLGIEIYFIRKAIETSQYDDEAAAIGQHNIYRPTFGPFVNLITTYFQIIAIICSFDVKIFTSIFTFVSVVGEPAANINFSLDCIFLRWNVNPDNKDHFAAPKPSSQIPCCYFILCGARVKQKQKNDHCCKWQPQIIKALIRYLSCRQLDPYDETVFIKGDEYFQCNTADYNSFKYWVIYPAIFCFCVFPLVLLKNLHAKKQENKLDDEWVRGTWGVLYNGLKKNSYFWGIVGIYWKIGLIIITKIYIVSNPELLAPFLIAWFYVYRLFLNYQKPYLSGQLFQAENYAVNAYLVTIFCAYFMIGNEERDYLMAFYLVLIVLVNVYAVGFVLFVIFIMTKRKAMDKFEKIKETRFWQFLARLFISRRRRGSEGGEAFDSAIESFIENASRRAVDYKRMEDPAVARNDKRHSSGDYVL